MIKNRSSAGPLPLQIIAETVFIDQEQHIVTLFFKFMVMKRAWNSLTEIPFIGCLC